MYSSVVDMDRGELTEVSIGAELLIDVSISTSTIRMTSGWRTPRLANHLDF